MEQITLILVATSKLIAESKPGYIFIRQQIDPEDGDEPVGLYKIEATTGQDETWTASD